MRNSSSLDWLRFMHTPNDYRVSRHKTRMNIMRTILLILLLSVAAISSFAQTNTYRECTSQNFKIISYTRELSPQGCQQFPIYVKPKRS